MDLQTALDPPFDENVFSQPIAQPATSQKFDHLFPAAYRNKHTLELPSVDLASLELELNVKRLNNVHEYLWLAGRPMQPRPLHYQRAASREIVVVEQMDLHLLWENNTMCFKPIPRYLLSHDFWKEHLVCKSDSKCACFVNECEKGSAIEQTSSNLKQLPPASPRPNSRKPTMSEVNGDQCRRRRLYKCALGFLLSYTALIQYESDFRIAKDAFLVPESVTWLSWRKLVKQLLSEKNRGNFNMRFRFGELRTDRLNLIYRFRYGSTRGYKFGYHNYSTFFHDNLAPIVSFITYIAIVLTALQLGLSTDILGDNETFQWVSYVFAIFSILSPLVFVGLIGCGFVILLFDNVFTTLSFKRKQFVTYDQLQATV
jgi:hypothetical protein